jgi:hypothetical protein
MVFCVQDVLDPKMVFCVQDVLAPKIVFCLQDVLDPKMVFCVQDVLALKIKALQSFKTSGNIFTKWYSVTSQKTWIFINPGIRTSEIAE